MTRNERFDKLTTDDVQFTSPAQFGNNVIVGEDSNGNPYLEELTNNNRATLQPDGTFDTSAVATEQAVINEAAPQMALNGYVVPVGPNHGVNDAIDPTATTTPVQDALDLLGAKNGGAVLLPPKTITESAPITGHQFKRILGWGVGRGGSAIEFTDLSQPGISQDPNVYGDGRESYWDGLTLHGSDRANRTNGHAIEFVTDNPSGFNIGRMHFTGWSGGPTISAGSTSSKKHPFGFIWKYLKRSNSDNDFINFEGGGPNCTIWSIQDRPNSGGATVNTDPGTGPALQIGAIETLGDPGGGAAHLQGGRVNINEVHFEPADTGKAYPYAVRTQGFGPYRIDDLNVIDSTTVDQALNIGFNSSNVRVGKVFTGGKVTINNSLVELTYPPQGPCFYLGSRTDVSRSYSDESLGYFFCADYQEFADPPVRTSVTLTTGASPAARLDDVGSGVGSRPRLQKAAPQSLPGAAAAYDWYFEWDSANGHWDLVFDWRTDPGSDLTLTVETGRPSSTV